MVQTIKNIWKNQELRKRILVTLLILFVYRLGCGIPVPFIRAGTVGSFFLEDNLLGYYNILSGGALSQCSIFAVGISTYITASIIVQLLTVAIPKLEKMAKEESGRQFVDKLTKGVGLALSFIMSIGYYYTLTNSEYLNYSNGWQSVVQAVAIVATMVAGAQIVIWLGWQIDEYGIGNGISLIIFVGILSRWSDVVNTIVVFINTIAQGHWFYAVVLVLIVIVCIGVTLYVVAANDAERRIQIQYAKRVVGAKMYGGNKTYIPIKLIASGVMPIIFASTICSLPELIAGLAHVSLDSNPVLHFFTHGFGYILLYAVLIVLFNYFYMSISFDAVEMANNLRNYGAAIPGYRPGKATSDYIQKETYSLIPAGSFVLIVVACLPTLMSMFTGMPFQFGGTSLLIMVGVAIEIYNSFDSALAIRHHKGFLSE